MAARMLCEVYSLESCNGLICSILSTLGIPTPMASVKAKQIPTLMVIKVVTTSIMN